jgi:hypothetical protein
MRVYGLTLVGVLALIAPIVAHAVPLGGKAEPGAKGKSRSSKYGAAAAGVGTPSPVTGANGEADGFRRIARRTTMVEAVPTVVFRAIRMAVGADMAGWQGPYGVGRNYGGGWGHP